MNISKDQLAALAAPLNANRVAKRGQGGRQLSYLEAWDVKATLIRIFGFGGFDAEVISSEIVSMEQVQKSTKDSATKKTILDYETVISSDDGQPKEIIRPVMHWIVVASVTMQLTVRDGGHNQARYTEVAIASQKGPDLGEVADFAMKTAESDALKRAAINLGTQFGLSLYDNGALTDVIRVVLEPEQSAMLKSIRDERQAASPGGPTGQSASAVMAPRADTPEAAAQIAAELGGQPVDDGA